MTRSGSFTTCASRLLFLNHSASVFATVLTSTPGARKRVIFAAAPAWGGVRSPSVVGSFPGRRVHTASVCAIVLRSMLGGRKPGSTTSTSLAFEGLGLDQGLVRAARVGSAVEHRRAVPWSNIPLLVENTSVKQLNAMPTAGPVFDH